ncbi:hypothetical protein RCF19_31835 [Rhodococcus qingshengii]
MTLRDMSGGQRLHTARAGEEPEWGELLQGGGGSIEPRNVEFDLGHYRLPRINQITRGDYFFLGFLCELNGVSQFFTQRCVGG